jgi:hypothetical protein
VIYSGDWIVYTIDVTMAGDGDVIDPVITDTPEPSLEILDFIGDDAGT